MKIFQQSFYVSIGVIAGCASHLPQLIYRYWNSNFNPNARNEWFLLHLIYLPIIGCVFQEFFMRTGKKWWAKIGLGAYLSGTILTLYMIIFGGAVAANGMFPNFSIGHEHCNEKSIVAQWTACFHLIGLGIELSAQVCAIILLIQCLGFTSEMINHFIIEERARMIAKLNAELEKEEKDAIKGNWGVDESNLRENDLSILDITEISEEKPKMKKSWNSMDDLNYEKEEKDNKYFKIKKKNADSKKENNFIEKMMFNEKAVRPYEVEGVKILSLRDESITHEHLEDHTQLQSSIINSHRSITTKNQIIGADQFSEKALSKRMKK